MLTGADLLAKVKELGDVSKSDLAAPIRKEVRSGC
jgi:hypothetical protein